MVLTMSHVHCEVITKIALVNLSVNHTTMIVLGSLFWFVKIMTNTHCQHCKSVCSTTALS